ncbi:hypothetical protein FBQ96_04835 [Nitrospirales bacterium NOB]|nr:MAG: hypothetical protein UZ03_NOB001002881 [Nitrospira sp. OLB3]MBV6469811.1 hypothetical protein [Nitrospirota bacterium]MCE7966784.1 hypothetical protein [Nitrospira sp. NTP2]MCK6494020.1 hypothetical protein [Nitrospira sp.]MDL1888898.1 hypothetical protein [Nitrospirales bacterium NOB]MEB2339963.1 hypothetical protein [Nitrospirales bacterium]
MIGRLLTRLTSTCLVVLLSSAGAAFVPEPSESELESKAHYNDALPTTVVVRVVAHRSLVLGHEVGGARVTITDVATGRLLASGLQQGESGDQSQIMRTPHLMEEPLYSARPAASFTTTLELARPTLVEITAEGPLAYPAALQRASKTVLLIPGHDLTNDGIVLHLYGYLVQVEQPKPGESLIAKEDVMLRASVRTLSGSLVRPHSDWDSRKVHIYGELLIEDRVVERLQMFYSGEKSRFEAPFFVPLPKDAPNGITLRVIAADAATGNFGMGTAQYPVVPERLRSKRN